MCGGVTGGVSPFFIVGEAAVGVASKHAASSPEGRCDPGCGPGGLCVLALLVAVALAKVGDRAIPSEELVSAVSADVGLVREPAVDVVDLPAGVGVHHGGVGDSIVLAGDLFYGKVFAILPAGGPQHAPVAED